ncbi:VOC family protein [Candidatus Microgenomates bacterium]|nr:VOC family protein [Candidatus Microgenomates bacterium]
MIRGLESITLFSENATQLAKWYRDKVGLEIEIAGEMGEEGEDKVYEVKVGEGSGLYIVDHSKVKGKNKEPERIIFNFEVDKMDDEVEKLKANGVKVIQDTYHMQEYGLITTFEDIDGNYFQLVQIRE